MKGDMLKNFSPPSAEAVEAAMQLLPRVPPMWCAVPQLSRLGNLEQRQRLQRLLFPEGVEWSEGQVKTVVTCRAVEYLRGLEAPEKEMAPRTGFKPVTSGSGDQRSIR